MGRLGTGSGESAVTHGGGNWVRSSSTGHPELDGIVQISAGGFHTCAATEEGKVVCWGRNFNGQLGNGGTANQSRAGHVVTGSSGDHLTGIARVGAGDTHTCALKSNGEVVCWGL